MSLTSCCPEVQRNASGERMPHTSGGTLTLPDLIIVIVIMSYIAQTFKLSPNKSFWGDTRFDGHFTLRPSGKMAGF